MGTDTMSNEVQMDDITDYDVFLSYPHTDHEEVMQICEALRARELTVWMDKRDIPDYANITRSIVDGLARSRVLLAYHSCNYSRSRACQWELTAAFLAAQHEGDPRRRVLVINPEKEWEHILPVELKDAEVPDSDDLDRLVSSVKARVDEIKGTIGKIHALNPPEWYGRKGLGSNRFVGRLPYLWQIHSALHASDFPIITGTTAAYDVAQVYGMGGVGKSLLAEEYALRFAAAFPGGVFWLSAFGNDDICAAEAQEAERIRQIEVIAVAFGISVHDRIPEEIEEDLKWKLGSRGEPFLWVVDDIPAGMDLETLERWLAPHPLGKTLITTRTNDYGTLGETIHLAVLEPEAAYQLLTSWRRPDGTEEEAAARGLAEDLEYHALAIDVADAALRAYVGIQPFAEFRKDLSNSSSDRDTLEMAKELVGILPNGHEASIASTVLRSIERLDPAGWDFLRLVSGLAVNQISVSLVSSVFAEVDGLDDVSARDRTVRAINQAENLSLAERVEGEEGAWRVHTLISRTVRFRDPVHERSNQLRDAALRVLTTEFQLKNEIVALKTTRTDDGTECDVFLSHSHIDAEVVEALAEQLDDVNLVVWLDKWNSIPGEKFQQAIAKGLNKARSCAVCIGEQTPMGWFREEIERALNRQTVDESFRVIPVLLPNADTSNVDDFLELRTWVDFENGIEDERAFHNLVCGIKGKPPGRWWQKEAKYNNQVFKDVEKVLMQIKRYYDDEILFREVAAEYQRKSLDKLIIDKRIGGINERRS